jgi:alpha-beta hydrolase superfamily lysophospholipase
MVSGMEQGRAGDTAYWVAGHGPPVVLIHGVGLNASIWEAQVAALAEHRQVVAYDMLGHGMSTDPPGVRKLGDFVDQLAVLLDALSMDRAALVGFSMGGLVARAFAAAYPERVSPSLPGWGRPRRLARPASLEPRSSAGSRLSSVPPTLGSWPACKSG